MDQEVAMMRIEADGECGAFEEEREAVDGEAGNSGAGLLKDVFFIA